MSKNIPNYVDDNDKLRKFDGIKYCDFHYHGITIIAIYCPTLSDTCAKFLEWGCTKEVYTIAGQCQALQSNFQIVHFGHCPAQGQLHSRNLVKCRTLSGTSAAPIWIFDGSAAHCLVPILKVLNTVQHKCKLNKSSG